MGVNLAQPKKKVPGKGRFSRTKISAAGGELGENLLGGGQRTGNRSLSDTDHQFLAADLENPFSPPAGQRRTYGADALEEEEDADADEGVFDPELDNDEPVWRRNRGRSIRYERDNDGEVVLERAVECEMELSEDVLGHRRIYPPFTSCAHCQRASQPPMRAR
eukprot:SAG11_NODE_1605_length_4593_cov_2.083667_6_plen_163_part_00